MSLFNRLLEVAPAVTEFLADRNGSWGVKFFLFFGGTLHAAEAPFLNLIDSTAILLRALCGIQITLQESTAGS